MMKHVPTVRLRRPADHISRFNGIKANGTLVPVVFTILVLLLIAVVVVVVVVVVVLAVVLLTGAAGQER